MRNLNQYANQLMRHAVGLDETHVAAFFSVAANLAARGQSGPAELGREARALVDEAQPQELAELAAAFEEDAVAKQLRAEFTKDKGLQLRDEDEIVVEVSEEEEPEAVPAEGDGEEREGAMAKLRGSLTGALAAVDELMGPAESLPKDNSEVDEILQDEDDNEGEDEEDRLAPRPVDLSATRESITLSARVTALENERRTEKAISRALKTLKRYGSRKDLERELKAAAKKLGMEGIKLFVEGVKKFGAEEPGSNPDSASGVTGQALSADAALFASLKPEALEVALTAEREIIEMRERGVNFRMTNAAYMKDCVRRAQHDVSGINVEVK